MPTEEPTWEELPTATIVDQSEGQQPTHVGQPADFITKAYDSQKSLSILHFFNEEWATVFALISRLFLFIIGFNGQGPLPRACQVLTGGTNGTRCETSKGSQALTIEQRSRVLRRKCVDHKLRTIHISVLRRKYTFSWATQVFFLLSLV